MNDIFVKLDKCVGCRQCEISCAVYHSRAKELYAAVRETPKPKQRVRLATEGQAIYSVRCFHCEDARCVAACIGGAMRRDEETGRVYNIPERCIGCWMCVMVCPYGVIRRDEGIRKALKCDRCPDEEVPACVRDCPTKALDIRPRL